MASADTPRAKPFDDRGRPRYLLTFYTNRRAHVFVALDVVTLVYEQIRRAALENGFAIVAYCFMPDHLHLLIEGTRADADRLRFVYRAKQYAGAHHARAFGGRRLWQRHSYERALGDHDDLRAIAGQVISNPIRAGLARRVEDYPFVGSDVYVIRGGSDARLTPGGTGQPGSSASHCP